MLNKFTSTELLSINERIRLILDRKGISDKTLAEAMGVSRSRLSQIFKAGVWDNLTQLRAVAKFLGYSVDYLITGKESFLSGEEPTTPEANEEDPGTYLTGKTVRPITVTLSPAGEELVSYVPVKAQAGYMRGYGDPQYVETLPAFSLPALVKNGTYRMFQVDGPSMQQLGGKGLKDGDIVIAQYVEDIFDLRDNRVYVVVSTEGIAIKRVINRLRDKESPCLVMMSDNKNGEHPNYLLKPKQIREVWEAKKFISSDFSFDTDMYQILAELQVEQARLKEEMKNLSKK